MNQKELSLKPLTFDDAVTDLLKVKPPPKPKRKAKAGKLPRKVRKRAS